MPLSKALQIALLTLLFSLQPLTHAADSTPDSPIPQQQTPAPGQPAFDAVFSHHKSDVNGVRLHYVTGGTGPVIVLLHGWAETWYTWRRVMPLLTQAGYSVVVPDLRGMGDSSRPSGGYDKKTVAGDIALLMEQLGHASYAVVGHDLGAQVAYALGRWDAAHVSSIAVLDAPVAGIPPWDELKVNPRLWHWTFYNVPDVPEMLIAGHEQAYFSWFYHQIAVNSAAVDEDLDEVVRAYSMPGALRGGLAYFRAFDQDANDNADYATHQLKMPVLALGASGGNGVVPWHQMRLAAVHVEGGVIEDSGHWIPVEKPQELVKRLVEFYSRNAQVQSAD